MNYSEFQDRDLMCSELARMASVAVAFGWQPLNGERQTPVSACGGGAPVDLATALERAIAATVAPPGKQLSALFAGLPDDYRDTCRDDVLEYREFVTGALKQDVLEHCHSLGTSLYGLEKLHAGDPEQLAFECFYDWFASVEKPAGPSEGGPMGELEVQEPSRTITAETRSEGQP